MSSSLAKEQRISEKELQIAQLIWQTRQLLPGLTADSSELLESFGINASHRAVLQFLDHKDVETVANMARARNVSRQHIQQVVNDLLEKKLVETLDNPKHKRSLLVKRTEAGDVLFKQVKKIESRLFREIAKAFDGVDLQTSVSTLLIWRLAKAEALTN